MKIVGTGVLHNPPGSRTGPHHCRSERQSPRDHRRKLQEETKQPLVLQFRIMGSTFFVCQ